MLRKREWTETEHELLRALLLCNTRTDEIAARFGVSRQYMCRYINDIGLTPAGWKSRYRPRSAASIEMAVTAQPIPESRVQNWWPLPAGSPESWSVISDQPWPGHER